MGFYKRKDRNNSWKFEHYMGYKPNGKRKVKTKTVKAKNEREAKRLYHLWVAEIELGEYQEPSRITLSKFVEEKWRPLYALDQLEDSSYDVYLTVLNSIFIPHFKVANLEDIRTIDIQKLFVDLGETRKPATLQKYKNIFSNVFSRAIEWGYIKSNPVTKVKLKGARKSTSSETYSIKELHKILGLAIKDDLQWATMVHLAFFCGLRRGEIAALTWDKVDLNNKEIRISKSLAKNKKDLSNINLLIRKETKENEVRRLELHDKLVHLLKQLKRKKEYDREIANEKWYPGNQFYVFSNDFGKPYSPGSITQRWSRFRKRHKLSNLSIHDLRHATATFLNYKKEDLKAISEFLGHSDTTTTLNTYTHIYNENLQKLTKHFDEFTDSEYE